jgi:hypothetical protein
MYGYSLGDSEPGSRPDITIMFKLTSKLSHSLETLRWHSSILGVSYTFGTKIPRFEKLRNLELAYVDFSDSGTVGALLEPALSVLDLYNCRHSAVLEQALLKRGRMPSLKTFICSPSKNSIDTYLEFLRENHQMSKLRIQGEFVKGGLPRDTLEEKILPLTSSSFKTIISLRLTWNVDVTIIPDKALAIISGMKTLEQVCLGAGCKFGWKHDWLIGHESMRNHLSNLPLLKKIAFTRESYEFQTLRGSDHERYYFEPSSNAGRIG